MFRRYLRPQGPSIPKGSAFVPAGDRRKSGLPAPIRSPMTFAETRRRWCSEAWQAAQAAERPRRRRITTGGRSALVGAARAPGGIREVTTNLRPGPPSLPSWTRNPASHRLVPQAEHTCAFAQMGLQADAQLAAAPKPSLRCHHGRELEALCRAGPPDQGVGRKAAAEMDAFAQ